MNLSTIVLNLYSANPPSKPHDIQRAHQLIHWLRASDIFSCEDQLTFQRQVYTCLERGGFLREALALEQQSVIPASCVSLACPRYPTFLSTGLGTSAPPVVWLRPSSNQLVASEVVIGGVGSRTPTPYRARLAQMIGRWVAARGYLPISGGAVGCDTAFVSNAGWHLLPCGLHQHPLSPDVGLCSMWPLTTPFSGYQAMLRNAQIYACASATFVISASCNTGGSWGGAVSALRSRANVIALLGCEDHSHEVSLAARRLCNLGAIPCDVAFAGHNPAEHPDQVFAVFDQSLARARANRSMATGLFSQSA